MEIIDANNTLFTIGHSNQGDDQFLQLLKNNNIEVLVDVRSKPYSKYAEQFNQNSIKNLIQANGMKYIFLGSELGGQPQDQKFYDSAGYVLYWRIAKATSFIAGIERLKEGIRNYTLAILCSEEDPTNCHRRLLIGRVLAESGFETLHIRSSGEVQSEDDLHKRVDQNDNINQLGFFDDDGEVEWKSTRSVLRKKQQQSFSGN